MYIWRSIYIFINRTQKHRLRYNNCVSLYCFQYVFDIKGQEDDLWISLEQEDKSRLDKDKGGKNESVGAVLIKVKYYR